MSNRLFALGLAFALGLCGLALFIPPPPGPVERADPADKSHRFYLRPMIREHVARYKFASQYCKENKIRSVADIACGTCYGMTILKEAVPVVDGYDKENLCNNYVLDLDRQAWEKQYDAIVSFETIEHLDRPEFFLTNAARSAPILLLSTPVNLGPEQSSPFHKQFWSAAQLKTLLEQHFTCEYFHYDGGSFKPGFGSDQVVAVCKRRS